MAHDVLHDCPVCHKPLHITKLHCPACGTSIEGDFQAERLLALTPEQRSLSSPSCATAATSARWRRSWASAIPPCARGWTRFLPRLGLEANPGKEKPARKEVLEMLAQGEITQEQALDMLKKP